MTNRTASGSYRIIEPPLERQLAMDAFAALPNGHPMVGLLELDVTAALSAIDRQQRGGERDPVRIKPTAPTAGTAGAS